MQLVDCLRVLFLNVIICWLAQAVEKKLAEERAKQMREEAIAKTEAEEAAAAAAKKAEQDRLAAEAAAEAARVE